METKYFSLSEREWRYKGEGNAHLTLTLPKDQLVLRIEKVLQDSPKEDDTPSSRLQLEVEFIKTVMTKLFGKNFVASPQIVYLKMEEVENVNNLIFLQRPEYRRHKKVGKCTATLWLDLCFLPCSLTNPSTPTFSVEIKPKQGVFAQSDHVNQQCLFCLKQDLKLTNGTVHKRSHYCPLNLFSGIQEKMMAALEGLLCTPQNNLKIYKNGEPVFDETSSPTVLKQILTEWFQPIPGVSPEKRFCTILLDVLTRNMEATNEKIKDDGLGWSNDGPPLLCRLADTVKRQPSADSSNKNSSPSCYWGPQDLPVGSVLQKLAAVQALGVCGHAAAYELYKQEISLLGSDDYAYVKDIIEAGCSSALSPLQSYLVAAMARDCSIMIAFQQAQDEKQKLALPLVTDPASGVAYVFQSRLMDLDPKPLSCVKKHHQRNYDIRQARKKIC